MTFERAKIHAIRPGVHLIDDAGDSTCYLICGSERALLVDTANGYEDLQAIVRQLTSLPVTVVNTHGHGDHIFGNVYFDEAWMHPADIGLADMFFGYAKENMDKHGLKPCPIRALEIGQVFDLGGVQLEVVDLKATRLAPLVCWTGTHGCSTPATGSIPICGCSWITACPSRC